MNLPVIAEPVADPITCALIDLFLLAERGRRLVEGIPMPLSVQDVAACLEVYPLDLSSAEIYCTVFELDRIRLDEMRSKA